MSYELEFVESALKEWKKLDNTVTTQFKKKLKQRLQEPHVLASKLSGFEDCYKIKLKSAGFRLVYRVIDKQIVVLVLSVGKRERNAVYKAALARHIRLREQSINDEQE